MNLALAAAAALKPTWLRTGDDRFPAAARMLGSWWVLRMNGFPEHPLWTVFVDGEAKGDLDDLPSRWGQPLSRTGPQLDGNDQLAVMSGLHRYAAYGSERGEPCEDPYCCGWD